MLYQKCNEILMFAVEERKKQKCDSDFRNCSVHSGMCQQDRWQVYHTRTSASAKRISLHTTP